ncbi:hypothetical protein [Ursidibacter sp. B-7004-1]
MEWLNKNFDNLIVGVIVTVIGGIILECLHRKLFYSKSGSNSEPKTEKNDKKLINDAQSKGSKQLEVNLTSYEKKLYSEVIQFTYRLVERITILAPLRYPQLDVEYSKFKLFLVNGVKDFDVKLEQSLEVSRTFKSNTKSFLNKIDANCYKLASFMGKDIGVQNVNILEVAQKLKDEIQEFKKTVKQ